MQSKSSPLLQSFFVLIQQHQIDGWTTKQIWERLVLPKETKDRSTQQELYRLLRKLVKHGYLVKQRNFENHRMSTFQESKKMNEYRTNFQIEMEKNNISLLESKARELEAKQTLLEKQILASEQALIDFPNLKSEILKQRNLVTNEIENLMAYNKFLLSLTATA